MIRDSLMSFNNHKFIVYYDEYTGEIIRIMNKIDTEENNPYMETSSNIARLILMGENDPRKFIIICTLSGMDIVEKNEYVRIKQAENHLSKIVANNSNNDRDINLIFYKISGHLEININQDTIYKMTGRRFIKKAKINPELGKYDNLILYIIKENDPNYLLDTIEVDLIKLIENGYIIYDLNHLGNYSNLVEIEVMTKRIFSSYGIKYKNTYYTNDINIRNKKRTHLTITDSIESDFIITKDQDDIFIEKSSNIDIRDDIELFFTTDDPCELLTKVNIPRQINDEKILINTYINIEKAKILTASENRKLTFGYRI